MTTRKAIDPQITPNPVQKQIMRHLFEEPGVRVVVAGTGRQVGKTEGCKMALIEGLARHGSFFKGDYGAPTYKRAGQVYEEMCHNLKPIITRKRDQQLTIEIAPIGRNREGGRLIFHSLEDHDNIRGDNSDLWVVDEMCDISESAWRATILPMLMARNGKALLLGTPKRVGVGFVWARAEWLMGQDNEAYPSHRSLAAPSAANPANTPDNLAFMAQGMTPDVYREEILGEWLDEEGAVFDRLDEAFSLPYTDVGTRGWKSPAPVEVGVKYIIGFDIASHEDYNIFSVWRLDRREQVALYRIRGEKYDTVLKLLHEVRKTYNNADIYADGNGMGAPIVQRLADQYKDGVVDRRWKSNKVKVNDITEARLAFQHAEWKFLAVPWQKSEFKMYTRDKRASGVWAYSAPEGCHDDSVAAACMVAERIRQGQRVSAQHTIPDYITVTEDGEIRVASEWFEDQEKKAKRKKRKWPWTRAD